MAEVTTSSVEVGIPAGEAAVSAAKDKFAHLPPWMKQQKKTFTKWVDAQVTKYGIKIGEITEGFHTGVNLMKLVEAISGESCGRAEKSVKMRIHKIQNINRALKKIEEHGVKLIGISAEEINEGNIKLILGMIWTLILRFQIQDISMEQMSAKDGLLLWCQKKTQDYANVNVQNFHMSFKDGLAFCALIHKHRPDLIDYDSLSKTDPMSTLQLAFDIMEKEYNVPQLLDAVDIVDMPKPDEMSVMAYVSLYYHAFQSNKQVDIAARRIANILKAQREIDALTEQYNSIVTGLLEWIREQRFIRQTRNPCASVDEVTLRLGEVNNYRKTEKADKAKEKMTLEDAHRALQNKLRLANRPAFVPETGKHVKDVNAEWKDLAGDEAGFDAYLREELARLQRIEELFATFTRKANSSTRWLDNNEARAASTELGDSFAAVVALQQQHTAFITALGNREISVQTLEKLHTSLLEVGYSPNENVSERVSGIQNRFATLKDVCTARSKALEEQEALMKRRDEMRLDFARSVDHLMGLIETVTDDVSGSVLVSSVEEAEGLNVTQLQFRDFVTENEAVLTELQDKQAALEAEGVTENVYSSYTVSEVFADWHSMIGALDARDSAIAEEIHRQQSAETLRIAYAEKANPLAQWMEDERNGIEADGALGTLEEQQDAYKARHDGVAARKPDLDEVIALSGQLEAELVFTNQYTNVTVEMLTTDYEQVDAMLGKAVSETENQIEQRDALGVSEDEIADLKKTFNHFDKDKSGFLDRLEFRACLMASEVDLPTLGNADQPDPKFDAIMAECDTSGDNQVGFQEFLAFMARMAKDRDSPEQLTESFKTIAGGKHTVTEAELSREFSPEDVSMLTSKMTPGDSGVYNFGEFVLSIYGNNKV